MPTMHHGGKSSAKTFSGFKEPIVLGLDSYVTREVVGCLANQPGQEAVELLDLTTREPRRLTFTP